MRRVLMQYFIATIILSFCPVAFAASPSNLLVNGSFEDGSFSIPPSGWYNLSGAQLPGWKINYGNVDLVTNAFMNTYVPDGSRVLDLNGSGPSSISQTFSTVAGQNYTLSFMYSNSPASPGAGLFQVNLWDGLLPNVNIYAATLPATSKDTWVQQVITFTANSALSGVTFSSMTNGASGPYLDQANVSPVPVPNAVWLLGSGVLGLISFRKRIYLA